MRWLVAAAGMVAWSLAGWENMPRIERPYSGAAGFVIGVGLLAAYWCGTRTKRSKAVAQAVASAHAEAVAQAQGGAAESSAQAQVLVINNPSIGAREAGSAAVGLDRAPWLQGAHRSIDLDETEAIETALQDVSERLEVGDFG